MNRQEQVGALAIGAITAGSAPAAATPQMLCPVDQEESVAESSTGTVSSRVAQGRTITVTAHDDIWAGNWFTGWNGADGWAGTRASSAYPLPGAPRYGLIGRLGYGPWRHIGRGPVAFTNTTTGSLQTLVLRVNDNVAGNGWGAFQAEISYPCEYRP